MCPWGYICRGVWGEEPCSRQPSAARWSRGTHGSELRVIWHGEKLGVRVLRKEEE